MLSSGKSSALSTIILLSRHKRVKRAFQTDQSTASSSGRAAVTTAEITFDGFIHQVLPRSNEEVEERDLFFTEELNWWTRKSRLSNPNKTATCNPVQPFDVTTCRWGGSLISISSNSVVLGVVDPASLSVWCVFKMFCPISEVDSHYSNIHLLVPTINRKFTATRFIAIFVERI